MLWQSSFLVGQLCREGLWGAKNPVYISLWDRVVCWLEFFPCDAAGMGLNLLWDGYCVLGPWASPLLRTGQGDWPIGGALSLGSRVWWRCSNLSSVGDLIFLKPPHLLCFTVGRSVSQMMKRLELSSFPVFRNCGQRATVVCPFITQGFGCGSTGVFCVAVLWSGWNPMFSTISSLMDRHCGLIC